MSSRRSFLWQLEAELERLLGYSLIADKEFRTRLCKDPFKAAQELDITLEDWQVQMLAGVSKRRLNAMAKSASNLVVRPLASGWREP